MEFKFKARITVLEKSSHNAHSALIKEYPLLNLGSFGYLRVFMSQVLFALFPGVGRQPDFSLGY